MSPSTKALPNAKSLELEAAKARLDAALAEFGQIDRMTNVESYIMGHVRCANAGVQSAVDFVMQCQAYRDVDTKKPKSQSKLLPPPK